MNNETVTQKIKCPHCGYIRRFALRIDGDKVSIVMGGNVSTRLKDLAKEIQRALSDKKLHEANAWIDLGDCPHCDQPYQYNLHTGETK